MGLSLSIGGKKMDNFILTQKEIDGLSCFSNWLNLEGIREANRYEIYNYCYNLVKSPNKAPAIAYEILLTMEGLSPL